MLTRNFDSIMASFLSGFPPNGTPKEADWLAGMPGAVKNHFGTMKTFTGFPSTRYALFGSNNLNDNISQIPTETVSVYMPILLIGKSNAEETYNDYCLDVVPDLTATGYRYINVAYTSEGCVYNTVKSFVNNTDEDVIVNEVGIYNHIDMNYDVLLYRKKLPNPVTMKAKGGTATFNIVINIPYANKP